MKISATAPSTGVIALYYAVTLALSAALIFVVEPFSGKLLLPGFGGVPAVWAGCVLFFQLAMLAGYGYAVVLAHPRIERYAPYVHAAVLLFALCWVPLDVALVKTPPDGFSPVVGILYNLAMVLGVPVTVCSATSPLLQHWFGFRSRNPYLLYVASNIGSLGALLAYPIIIEPLIGLNAQAHYWSAFFVLLLLLIAAGLPLAVIARKSRTSALAPVSPVTTSSCLMWMVTSFIPSALMLAVTLHLTTNIAAFPLLWVLPLALYLLSFILAFAGWPHTIRKLRRISSFVILVLSPLFFCEIRGSLLVTVALHLGMFFILALWAHRLLAESKPPPAALTSFYWWVSCGGALGGIFVSFIAPFCFSTVAEYPLLCGAALFLGITRQERTLNFLSLVPAILFLVLSWLLALANADALLVVIYGVGAVACYFWVARPLQFATSFSLLLAVLLWRAEHTQHEVLFRARNFFGAKKVVVDAREGVKSLYHGTTVHGCQALEANRPLAQCYYHPAGPLGEFMRARTSRGRIAVVGLGIGSMSCYAGSGDVMSFFEIDPLVATIAKEQFLPLQQCGSNVAVVVGDGRLLLQAEAQRSFNLIVIDAFSSDAIPAHLLTLEAMGLYLSRIGEQGSLLFHISNNYLDIAPLLGGLARYFGLTALQREDDPPEDAPAAERRFPSHYLSIVRDAELARALVATGWRVVDEPYQGRLWSDDFSEIRSVLLGSRGKLLGVR